MMELWKMQKANVYTFFITCFPSLSPPGKEKVFVKNSCANNTNLKTDNTDARVPERQKLEQSKSDHNFLSLPVGDRRRKKVCDHLGVVCFETVAARVCCRSLLCVLVLQAESRHAADQVPHSAGAIECTSRWAPLPPRILQV